jgi:hypothetical protein
MKKLLLSSKIAFVFFAVAVLFQSCLKDSATKTYTIYRPVYKSIAEVRAAIKSDAATPIIHPGKIFVLGHYIFLNEVDKGIHIIDNSNPSSPVNKYFVSIPGNLDLAVKGNALYADQYRDLLTIDISNPVNVQVKKITEKVFQPRQYANYFLQDTTKMIVNWIKKDTTVNANDQQILPTGRPDILWFSNPAAQSAAPPTAGISGSMARFTLMNNYLYTVTDYDLNVFNVSDAENPVYTNKINLGWQIETIYPFKNKLFIGSMTGIYIFDVSMPSIPAQTSRFAHLTQCDPVIADNDYAYVTLHGGAICHGTLNQLDVLNIADINTPYLVRSYPLTNPHGLSQAGNTLFVCDAEAGLKVFNTSNPGDLKLIKTIDGINTYDVITQNGTAIVVAADGLYEYNFNDVNNITLQGKINFQSQFIFK